MENENCEKFSVSVFLTDIILPQNRSSIIPADRVLLVLNKKKRDENGKIKRKAGWSLPGGHGEYGEKDPTAARRELLEETGVLLKPLPRELEEEIREEQKPQAIIIDNGRMFLSEKDRDIESKPEQDEYGKLIYKTHWHLTVGARLLVPADEVVIVTGKEDIAMAGFYRFDNLPEKLFFKHNERIEEFYNRLQDEKLFNEIFKPLKS